MVSLAIDCGFRFDPCDRFVANKVDPQIAFCPHFDCDSTRNHPGSTRTNFLDYKRNSFGANKFSGLSSVRKADLSMDRRVGRDSLLCCSSRMDLVFCTSKNMES